MLDSASLDLSVLTVTRFIDVPFGTDFSRINIGTGLRVLL